MTKPKTITTGHFSEPALRDGGFPPGFQSHPTMCVSKKTGKFITDFERSQKCLNSGGWRVRPVALPGSLT